MELEVVVRWVGLLISIAGALLVSPRATRHRASAIRSVVLRFARGIAAGLGWPRTQDVSPIGIASGSAVGTVRSTGWGIGDAWSDSASTDEKIQRLRERIDGLQELLAEVRREAVAAAAEHLQQLEQAKAELHKQIAELRGRIEQIEITATEDDSRALPVIVGGIVLSGLSPELGGSLLAALFFIVLGLVGTASCYARVFHR